MKLTRVEAEIIIETAFPDITLKEAREALNNLDEAGVIREKEFTLGSLTVPVGSTNTSTVIPMPCRACAVHPSNGGTGICHCTLGGTVNCNTAVG